MTAHLLRLNLELELPAGSKAFADLEVELLDSPVECGGLLAAGLGNGRPVMVR